MRDAITQAVAQLQRMYPQAPSPPMARAVAGAVIGTFILAMLLYGLERLFPEQDQQPALHDGTKTNALYFLFDALIAKRLVTAASIVVLIAAAVTRRLHDRNRRGFWGLMPLPFTAFGIASMPIMLPGVWHHTLSVVWWAALILQNLLYYASLILLIVMLAGRDSAEPNRFGPAVTDWRFQP